MAIFLGNYKQHFLENLHNSHKTCEDSFFYNHPVGNNGPLKKCKKDGLWRLFLSNIKTSKF